MVKTDALFANADPTYASYFPRMLLFDYGKDAMSDWRSSPSGHRPDVLAARRLEPS